MTFTSKSDRPRDIRAVGSTGTVLSSQPGGRDRMVHLTH